MAPRDLLAQPRFPAANWEQRSLEVRLQVWPCWFMFIQLCWCVALWTDHVLVFASQHREDPLLSRINREINSRCKQIPASTACVCIWLSELSLLVLFFFFSILLQISGLKHNPRAAAFISLVLECLSSIHKHLVNFSACMALQPQLPGSRWL